MKFSCIVSDLDGTLLVGEELPPDNLEALIRARENGCAIIVATARWAKMALRISEQVGIDFPVIACSGAQVYDPRTGEDVFDARLPDAFVDDLYALCDTNRCIATVTVGDEVLLKLDGQPDLDTLYPEMRWVERLAGANPTAPRVAAVQGTATVQKIKSELWPPYRDQVNVYDSIGPTGKIIVMITSRQADKGEALRRACAHLDIPTDQVIAFGDAENDLEMFKVAGYSVAMGQSDPSVLAAADATTGRNDEAGVAQYLNRHLL